MIRQLLRPLPILAAILIALLAAPVAAVIYHDRAHSGRVFTGVRLNGVDMSKRSPEEVFSAAQRAAAYYSAPALSLKAGDKTYALRPAEAGSVADPAAAVRGAMAIGRTGTWINQMRERALAYWYGVDVGQVLMVDDHAVARVVAAIAGEVNKPAIDAALALDGGVLSTQRSQNGATLDEPAAAALIISAVRERANGEILLPLKTLTPRLASIDTASSEIAHITSNDLVVLAPQWDKAGAPQPPQEVLRIPRAEMSNMVMIDRVQNGDSDALKVRIRRETLRTRIEPLTRVITGTAEDARLFYDEKTGAISALSPSRAGRQLDVDASLDAIEAAARSESNRAVVLVVKSTPPGVPDTASAADLGISGLITQATTFFKGSSAARIVNVKVAAARFHGVVIPPGAVFSFINYLGDVSKESGFEEGLIIVGNRTEKGVGGGVCQVSTTAFQAALRAGFPILERYPHGYRVSYYERGMGAGYDAAVFTPWADLKFRNNTAGHLLIETVYDPVKVTLTFKFFGAPDGRQVTISPSKIGATIPKLADLYEPDPENLIAAGQVKQIDHAVDGATLTFERTVLRGGETLIDESITSKYVPWRNVFRFGPGFQPPAGAEIAPVPLAQ